jgi:hypothetical protein
VKVVINSGGSKGARKFVRWLEKSMIPVSAGDPRCSGFYLSSVLSHAKTAASESGLRLLPRTPTANHTPRLGILPVTCPAANNYQ